VHSDKFIAINVQLYLVLMEPSSLVKVSLLLSNQIYINTKFEDNEQAKIVFDEIQSRLPLIATQDKHGVEIGAKFSSFANAVNSKGAFKDMIKIIWRTVKTKAGQPQYKLCLFIVAMASLIRGISSAFNKDLDNWVEFIIQWLGNQLTIGGQGVTGVGQGKVIDLINQFFLTPYLHDFD